MLGSRPHRDLPYSSTLTPGVIMACREAAWRSRWIRVIGTSRWIEEPPLDCPISVFGGRDDASVPHEDLKAWTIHSTKPSDLRLFPGGHFYLHTARQPLLAEISRVLTGILEQAGRSTSQVTPSDPPRDIGFDLLPPSIN